MQPLCLARIEDLGGGVTSSKSIAPPAVTSRLLTPGLLAAARAQPAGVRNDVQRSIQKPTI